MNLEETVRAAVHDLADDAPRPADLADLARRRGRSIRRRRRAGVAAVAGLALITAAGIPFVLNRTPAPPIAQAVAPTEAPVRLTKTAANWWEKPVTLPGGVVVTALTRNDVGRSTADGDSVPAARTLQAGNVVLDRTTGRYEALTNSYYTVWGAPRGNQSVVSDGAAGLGVLQDTGAPRWVVAKYALDPQWSPDGTRLLLTTTEGFSVVDAATGEIRKHSLPEAVAHCPDWCLFTWLPGGKSVAVARRDPSVDQSESKPDTIQDIAIYDATNGDFIEAVPVAGAPVASGAWSPNTGRVLVQSADRDGDQSIVDIQTGRVLGTIPERNALFLVDGRILGLANDAARLYDGSGKLVEQMTLPADFADRTISVGFP